MHVHSAQPAVSPSLLGAPIALQARAGTRRIAVDVGSVGYLVPRTPFSGHVHSVFAQACNIACRGTLLTLCASSVGDGPTQLRLARSAPHDLRDLFDVGEPLDCRQERLQTRRCDVRLMHAGIWWPAALHDRLPPSRIAAHLRCAQRGLAQCRHTHTSVLDGAGASVVRALRDGCRALDHEQVERHADRLIGWGEGLTPAGDDFLVGLAAGLDALVRGDERRREVCGVLTAALRRGTSRTTPIAAHYLHLAAGGQYTEPLLRLRHAWLCEDDASAVEAALHRALAVGATSGADTVSGLLAGLQAWLPAPSIVEAA
jgi:hypothetical protein